MKYPIKYAIEELKVDGGYEYGYEKIAKGYIVSKCYVLESRFNYANEFTTHVVSFPYDNFDSFVSWYYRNSYNYNFDIYKHYYEQRRNPDRELLRDDYPHHIICEMFTCYEEAKNIADSKNSCLRGKILTNTGSAAYDKLSKEFNNMMNICSEYEKYIFANTSDMEVSIEELKHINAKDSVVLAQKVLKRQK